MLAYHGTIAPRHGVDLAVRAFARALAVNPSLRFRIVGDGDGVPAVIAAIAQERVEHAVELINRIVPVHEVPALLNDASAGIISVRSSEATEMMLPVKLLEYARLGIAVIAPRTRTIAHHFGDDAICFADPVDLDATARAILTLSADPARRGGLIERAAAIVEANGWSHQKQRYAALIRRLARP